MKSMRKNVNVMSSNKSFQNYTRFAHFMLTMFRCFALCLFVNFAYSQNFGSGVDHITNDVRETETVDVVGRLWCLKKIPAEIVSSAPLSGAEPTWRAEFLKNYLSSGYNVIWLYDRRGTGCVYFQNNGSWILLEQTNKLSYINSLLRIKLHNTTVFSDEGQLETMIAEIANLWNGSLTSILSKHILAVSEDVQDWLRGTEKSAKAFKYFCVGPVVINRENEYILYANMINYLGGVDAWRITIDKANREVVDVKMFSVCPSNTFHYNYIGG